MMIDLVDRRVLCPALAAWRFEPKDATYSAENMDNNVVESVK